MQDPDSLSIRDDARNGEMVSLARAVSAIQIVRREDGSERLGLLSQLAAGTCVEICGGGFNERTLKVCLRDQYYYFVFLEDLEVPKIKAAGA
jgi:hypothetical protein